MDVGRKRDAALLGDFLADRLGSILFFLPRHLGRELEADELMSLAKIVEDLPEEAVLENEDRARLEPPPWFGETYEAGRPLFFQEQQLDPRPGLLAPKEPEGGHLGVVQHQQVPFVEESRGVAKRQV